MVTYHCFNKTNILSPVILTVILFLSTFKPVSGQDKLQEDVLYIYAGSVEKTLRSY